MSFEEQRIVAPGDGGDDTDAEEPDEGLRERMAMLLAAEWVR